MLRIEPLAEAVGLKQRGRHAAFHQLVLWALEMMLVLLFTNGLCSSMTKVKAETLKSGERHGSFF